MDQTASADQTLLRDIRKCSENPNLDHVSVYVLVAIVKKRLTLDASLYTLLQILSVTLFEKIPMDQALTGDDTKDDTSQITNQLNLLSY